MIPREREDAMRGFFAGLLNDCSFWYAGFSLALHDGWGVGLAFGMLCVSFVLKRGKP